MRARFLFPQSIAVAIALNAPLVLTAACGNDVPLAPKATKLEAVEKAETAAVWAVQSKGASVSFEMEAPFERQDGQVPESALSGALNLDPNDLTKSTGLVAVDISQLEIFMQKAEEEGQFGEREKNDTQNEHMRDWLEIGDDVPADVLEANRRVEFSIVEVSDVAPADNPGNKGTMRTMSFTAKGEFLLHQRKSQKTVKMEATFHFDGDVPIRVDVRTLEPFAVSLAEHDVRPRTGFGVLAKKTLGALSSKVAEQAQVSVSFSAVPQASS